MLTNQAQNAFLKTLEEPPPNVVFILCTTEPDKLKETIVSRTQVHQFHRIPASKLAERLLYIAKNENVELDNDAAMAIARNSEGGARDAIGKLDSAINVADGNHITLSVASKVLGTIGIESIGTLADAIIDNNTAAILQQIGHIVDNSAMLQPVYMEILRYFDTLMVASTSPDYIDGLDYGDSTNARLKEQSSKKSTDWFLAVMEQLLKYGNLIDSAKGRIALETMALSVSNLQTEKPVQQVIVKETVAQPQPEQTKAAATWDEIKTWLPPQASFILNKIEVSADENGLCLEQCERLSGAEKDLLKMLKEQIKSALQKHNLGTRIELFPQNKPQTVSSESFFGG
jgi:DNA polymerase-3 subunit gamma/tau